jgi:hypothetical protein
MPRTAWPFPSVDEGAGFRIGMVAVVQTFGDLMNVHPHVHALATRGDWDASGTWLPVPYVDESATERLFRHKVIKLLRDVGLLSEKRIELLEERPPPPDVRYV